MFESSPFNKLEASLKDLAYEVKHTFTKMFGDAFSELSDEVQAKFDPRAKKMFRNISHTIDFKVNPKHVDAFLNELKDSIRFVEDQAAKIEAQMTASDERIQAEEALYKSQLKGVKTVEEMLELDDQRYQNLQKYSKDIKNLTAMQQANSGLLQGLLARQKQIANATQQTGWAAAFWGHALKNVSEVYLELRKNASAAQTLHQFDDVYIGWITSAAKGMVFSTKQHAQSVANLSAAMGSMDVPRDAATSVSDMTERYGVANEAAANLVSNMTRFAKWSKTAAFDNVQISKALADKNGVGRSTIMRDMAKNSQLMANYVGRGHQAFVKSLIAARQFGVEMAKISGFADNLVNDFENTLMMEAKMQTVQPGFDMSEVIYASQNGTDEQVMEALSTALKSSGMELGTLPRSIRNMVSSTLGLSVEDIAKLTAGKQKPGAVESATKEDIPSRWEEFGQSFADILATNKKLILGLGAVFTALTLNTAALLAKIPGIGKLGGLGGKIRGLGVGGALKGAGRLAGGAAGALALGTAAWQMGKGFMSGDDATAWKAFEKNKGTMAGAAIGTMIAPGVGTLAGAGIGGLADVIMNKMGANVGFNAKAAPAMNLPTGVKITPTPSAPPAAVEPPKLSMVDSISAANTKRDYEESSITRDRRELEAANNKRSEELLGQILSAIKAGQIIQMDGKKVGETILRANHKG